MQGVNRSEIKIGQWVLIVQKQDQRTGNLTEGIVKDILTKSPTHPHGIKVRLESGIWLQCDMDPTQKKNWPKQHAWLLEQLEKFQLVFGPRVKE